MTSNWTERGNDREMPSADALLGQFAARLQDALVDMREATTPTIVVQRATREEVPVEPVVVRVAQPLVTSGPAAQRSLALYDEQALPRLRTFPRGPVGRLQVTLIRWPHVYKLARWFYRRWSNGEPHVVRQAT
jgi:hypothetical protein